jgi:hypothetical protein
MGNDGMVMFFFGYTFSLGFADIARQKWLQDHFVQKRVWHFFDPPAL